LNGFSQRLAGSIFPLVLILISIGCSASQPQRQSAVAAAFSSFDRFQDSVIRGYPSTKAASSKIHERYRQLFSRYQTSAAATMLSLDDVAVLFRAADTDYFYTVSPVSLDDMALDLAELHRRGVVRKENEKKFYAALVESRHFDKARVFAKLHPFAADQTVPDVVDTVARDGPTTLVVKDGGKKLVRKAIDLSKGRHIVITSSPLCHFSPRAIRSIESDAVLRPLIRDHALWIVPPDRSTSFSTVANWNRFHPHEQMEFAYRREEWPMIERWETPVFYFLKDGHVVSKVTGWPVAGRKADIRRSLRLAGLM
jgi:hypothetical protein